MTADFMSKKCGMATIKTTSDSMPMMPLFSPVLHSTKPYSQSKSNTQRALMLPDEILRLPNEQSIVLIRGQKPLMLYKIIPDELPTFDMLKTVKIIDYMPVWKKAEAARKSKTVRSVIPEAIKSETKDMEEEIKHPEEKIIVEGEKLEEKPVSMPKNVVNYKYAFIEDDPAETLPKEEVSEKETGDISTDNEDIPTLLIGATPEDIMKLK